MSSIGNAGSVLGLFTPQRNVLLVTEVAQLLGMPKSSTSRLLKTMRDAGLLASVDGKAGYRVGNLIFETARRHRANSTLSLLADEALAEIAMITGHTGYVAILDGNNILGVRMRHGSRALRVVTSPGDRLPAFASASGRALLARLDDEAVRALHPAPLKPPSPHAPQSLTELLAALEIVRDKGWAEATDECLPGVESVAVCVQDRENSESIGVCVSYSAHLISPNEKTRIVAALMSAARDMAMKFDDEFWMAPRFAPFSVPLAA